MLLCKKSCALTAFLCKFAAENRNLQHNTIPMSISKTRQKLIEVARELFATKGIEATTMNDIATLSGKGRRTLYTYFRSKEDIYLAVVENELEYISDEMDKVVHMEVSPDKKLILVIYKHLSLISDIVKRNGNLNAEFFNDIKQVERARRRFDMEEINTFRSILREGVADGVFVVDSVDFTADVIHFAVKGIEVPYIFDRIGSGISVEDSMPLVERIICRALGVYDLKGDKPL